MTIANYSLILNNLMSHNNYVTKLWTKRSGGVTTNNNKCVNK